MNGIELRPLPDGRGSILDEFETTLPEKLDALRRYQHWELLRIGACDSFGLLDFKSVTLQLSLLADGITQAALALLADELGVCADEFCVLAFGKLGGEELNYSSDIDLVFICQSNAGQYWELGQRLIRALMDATSEGFLYRVDMRLRPWGKSGALFARSMPTSNICKPTPHCGSSRRC